MVSFFNNAFLFLRVRVPGHTVVGGSDVKIPYVARGAVMTLISFRLC